MGVPPMSPAHGLGWGKGGQNINRQNQGFRRPALSKKRLDFQNSEKLTLRFLLNLRADFFPNERAIFRFWNAHFFQKNVRAQALAGLFKNQPFCSKKVRVSLKSHTRIKLSDFLPTIWRANGTFAQGFCRFSLAFRQTADTARADKMRFASRAIWKFCLIRPLGGLLYPKEQKEFLLFAKM